MRVAPGRHADPPGTHFHYAGIDTEVLGLVVANATLRDWARLGLLLANNGALNGRQIIPRDWVIAATSVAANWLAPGAATPGNGYGYQVWLRPGLRRKFVLLGIHGQAVFVDPAAKLVMVHTAVRLKPVNDPGVAEAYVLWRALVQRFSR